MEAAPILLLACTAAAAGVAALRVAWGRRKRSLPLNAAGWGLFAAAGILGWAAAGAWGFAVAALAGMTAAAVALGAAAARAAPGKASAPKGRVRMLPEAGEPLHLLRRLVTFLMVGVLALPVSIGLGLAARALADAAGWSEANANVVALFVVPLAWGILAYLVLIQPRRRTQWGILLAATAPALLVVLAGTSR